MSLIGDFERAFATSLYPIRLPLAIGILVVLALLARAAYRRHWLAVARRHPARTAAILLPSLVVGIPLAWYLSSPLVIRNELQEPAPIAISATPTPGAVAATASPNAASPAPTTSPTATPVASAAPSAGPVLAGSFSGADDFHFGRGRASLVETSPGQYTLRLEDFSVRNGPDLYVYLSPDPAGYAGGAVELGRLKATDGSFNYEVAAGTDVESARSVVIWCRQFAVQFAVAPLAAA